MVRLHTGPGNDLPTSLVGASSSLIDIIDGFS
jgi:hypothetical protein